ncbi:MAG TPA: GLUG motif-containing protein, partial [Candidatus Sumerlaeota bacterium]|nr:GLUG motif-containing protein [Candidatus Sumerlaeota bacterium]
SYEIRTLAELQAIATGDLTGYYTLMNDIDASATATWNDAGTTTDTLEGFKPIGISSPITPDTVSFRGVLDGNGKKILGVTINRPDTRCVGLFEAVGAGGEILDLTLAGGTVAGGSGAGALVGANTQGIISNCHSSSKVSAKTGPVGGLLGSNEKGFVRNCSTSEAVVGENTTSAGGLIGWNSGDVVDSVATGVVKVTNMTWGSLMFKGVGGLIGANNSGGKIVNSFSTGPVEGLGQYYIVAGGLAGTNNGSIRNSFASSSVKGRTINGSSSLPALGGFVGLNAGGTVTDCFALGTIEGTFNSSLPYLGGLIGQLNGGSVSNCFSIGAVADFGTYIGGLIGRVSGGTVTACYWDKDTSGQTASAGGAGVVGKNSWAMKR